MLLQLHGISLATRLASTMATVSSLPDTMLAIRLALCIGIPSVLLYMFLGRTIL